MIESARRHGPFDPRHPSRHPRATAAPSARAARGDGRDRLDWRAFAARYFPGRRRHDLEALAASEAYSNGAPEWPGDVLARQAGTRLARRLALAAVEHSEAARLSTAVQAWEDEGGAATVRDRTLCIR